MNYLHPSQAESGLFSLPGVADRGKSAVQFQFLKRKAASLAAQSFVWGRLAQVVFQFLKGKAASLAYPNGRNSPVDLAVRKLIRRQGSPDHEKKIVRAVDRRNWDHNVYCDADHFES